MNPYIAGGVAGVVGLIVGFFLDRLLKGSAYKGRDEILQQAERDAENYRKDQEIKAKEEMLERREQLEEKLEELREGVRDRERENRQARSTAQGAAERLRQKRTDAADNAIETE